MEEVVKKILRIAEENPIGFTIYLPNCEFATRGWVIADKDTQNQFGEEGLRFVLEYALEMNRLIGGWLDQKDNQFHFDAVIVQSDRSIAEELMRLHNQKAIFNLESGEEIDNPDYVGQ